jgi:broad specificity phosphatase PhoE
MLGIITVRHAATEYSGQRIIAGRLDIPISKEGIEEVKSLRPFARKLHFDAVVSSPQIRALRTAQLLTEWPSDRIDVRIESAERDYGAMQGLTPDELKGLGKEIEYVRVGGIDHSLNPPGGETFKMLRRRAEKLKAYLSKNYKEKRVIVVSHQTFLQQFHGALTGTDEFRCLEQDIRILEFNFFGFDSRGRIAHHHVERPTKDGYESW